MVLLLDEARLRLHELRHAYSHLVLDYHLLLLVMLDVLLYAFPVGIRLVGDRCAVARLVCAGNLAMGPIHIAAIEFG